VIVYLVFVALWSARAGWSAAHRLAIGAAALLTYAWHSFIEQPVGAAAVAIDLIGNAVFTLGALALIWVAWRRRQPRAAAE
jgi:hypothetical protein